MFFAVNNFSFISILKNNNNKDKDVKKMELL